MNVSVAMATYNGEKYIKEQLDSIIIQLNSDDEVIICDDGSTDSTLNILEEYVLKDNRIKVYKNSHKGVILNFEDAISKCSNDIIILSDQDDIWELNKVKVIKANLDNENILLVSHNGINFSDAGVHEKLINHMNHGVVLNIINSCYWGCCMAFKKELVISILPFPKGLVAHDQWIGIIAESQKCSRFINDCLIKHRIHSCNVSKRMSLVNKVNFRYRLMKSYLTRKLLNLFK